MYAVPDQGEQVRYISHTDKVVLTDEGYLPIVHWEDNSGTGNLPIFWLPMENGCVFWLYFHTFADDNGAPWGCIAYKAEPGIAHKRPNLCVISGGRLHPFPLIDETRPEGQWYFDNLQYEDVVAMLRQLGRMEVVQ